jgi:sugar lactone lactonase YvrE
MTVSLQGFTTNGAISDHATINPFGSVTVTDSNAKDSLSATISFTAANGSLSEAGLSAGVVSNGIVSYALSATSPANLQSKLQALLYTPTAGLAATTQFTLSVKPTMTLSSGINVPQSVAVDNAGNVLVADYGNNTVEKFSVGGTLLWTQSSGVSNPVSVAVDSLGDVFVAANGNIYGNGAVTEFSSSGVLLQTLSNGVSNPYGVAVDSVGDVFVANNFTNTVEAFSASGALLWAQSSGVTQPQSIAVDSAGNVFVANAGNILGNNTVEEFSSSGVLLQTLRSGIRYPQSIAIDSAGDVFVANYVNGTNDTVEEFSASGALLRILASGVNSPDGVAVDSAGNVFVANQGNNTVEAFSASGALLQTLNSGVSNPLSVAVDSTGDVFVANQGNNTVEEFSTSVINNSSQVVALPTNTTGALPKLNNLTVMPSDLNNSAYVKALLNSGDTQLTLALTGTASSSYSVPIGFTAQYIGGASGSNYMVGVQSNLSVATPSAGSSSGFQQMYTVQIQGYSSDYTLTSYNGTATLTSKSSGQAITVNIPQPVAGANNRGVDVQFLDGSVSVTGYTDAASGIWTAFVTQGVAPGGNLNGWYNSSSLALPATGSGQMLDLGSAGVQNSLLNSADNSQSTGFYGGASIGLLPTTVTTINNSTPNAILTGILGAGANNPATFISGDSINLAGGNTTLNLFDFSGGTALPANATVSGVNTLNLASRGSIGSAGSADNFTAWSGLTTLNVTVSATGIGTGNNGLINVVAGSSAVVNLTAKDAYSTTNGLNSQVGAVTLIGGSIITITQNLSTVDGSAISGGGITVNGGSATSSVTVTQSAAVSGKVSDSMVILNDVSANSTTLAGSLTTVVLNNYGSGSSISDNAIRSLSLSGTGGTLTINDSNTGGAALSLTLTGLSATGDNTVTDQNSEISSLNIITVGTTGSTLNGFVDSHLTSISIQGSSALTLLNPSASVTSYSVDGSTASLTVAAHSGANEATLTLNGAVTYNTTADAISTGIILAAGTDNSNISFTTTGALGSSNSNSFTLGNGNNTLSDIVRNAGSTTTISVGTGSNQISTGSNSVNIAVGSHASGIVDSFSVGANGNGSLSILTTLTGAQKGDMISMADAAQFNGTAITAANVASSGGDAATLTGWVNAALSAQGANLQSHGVSWFNFGGNTYLLEQANSQGSAFAAGDTLVKLVGTLNESTAVLNGHALTL